MIVGSSIWLTGMTSVLDKEPERIVAHVIAPGIAQLAMAPFYSYKFAAKDIVAFDDQRRVTHVLIRNGRTFYGELANAGLGHTGIARNAERVGRFLGCHLIQCSFVTAHPRVFSMSVDCRILLERILDLGDKSLARFRIIQRSELAFQ